MKIKTYMTANMNAYCNAACPACTMPLTMSCDATNGGAVRNVTVLSMTRATDDSRFTSALESGTGSPLAVNLFAWMICALYRPRNDDDACARRTSETHRLLQCAYMTALHAAIHRSTIASKNSPMHAPIIAPVLFGTHPRNQSMSPVVKCR